MTDREPLYALVSRQKLELTDCLHLFAYNARRAIELAEEYEPGTLGHAQGIELRGYGQTEIKLELMEDAQPLADKSLWWVLGRIIHARELKIHELEDPEVGTPWAAAPRITMYWTPIAFSVRSDYDGPDERHFVETDRLLAAFLALRDRFVAALKVVGIATDRHAMFL